MTIRKKKTLLLITVAVCFILAIVAWQFTKPSAAGPPRLERFLPSTTLGFLQAYDLRAQTLHITQSTAWSALLEQDPMAGPLLLMGANHAGIMDASYALALVGLDVQGGHPAPQAALLGHFNSTTSLRMFEHRLLQKLKAPSPNRQNHNGIEILLWEESPKGSVAYAKSGNLAVMSNSVPALRMVLDVARGRATSLAGNPRLIRARQRASSNDEMFGFLDGEQLQKALISLPDGSKQKEISGLLEGMGLTSIESGSMASSFEDGRVLETFDLHVPLGGNGFLRELLSNPPTQTTLLNWVPEEAHQVADASIANSGDAFKHLKTVMAPLMQQHGGLDPDDFLLKFHAKTGIDFQEELLKSLGGEICLAQITIESVSRQLLLINVLDETGIAKLFEKVAQKNNWKIHSEDFQGIPVHQINMAANHSLGWAFFKGNLAVSTSMELIKKSLATQQNGKSLGLSPAYLEARQLLQQPPMFIYYRDNRDYLKQLESLLKTSKKGIPELRETAQLKPSFAFGCASASGFQIRSYSPLGTFPSLMIGILSHITPEGQDTASPHH